MAYKEKECPTCGVKHNKRGPYCSRSCGNSRPMPEYQKQTMSEVKREWAYGTDAGEESRWRLNNHQEEEPPQPVRDKSALPDRSFVQDGDIWTVCD